MVWSRGFQNVFLKNTGFPWWYIRAAKIGAEQVCVCVCVWWGVPSLFLPQEFCSLCFTFGFLYKTYNWKRMDSEGKFFLNPWMMESWRHRFFSNQRKSFFFFCIEITKICCFRNVWVISAWGLVFFPGASPGGISGKGAACQCRRQKDVGSITGLGRSPGAGHGNPLQYSCLENPMNRGAWRATVHGVTKSWTWMKWLSMHICKAQRFSVFCARIGAALVRVPKHHPTHHLKKAI